MPKSSNYIIPRGTTFYYRRRVPQDVIQKLGYRPNEVYQVSLRTKDIREAHRLAEKEDQEFDEMCANVRAGKPIEEHAAIETGLSPEQSLKASNHYFSRFVEDGIRDNRETLSDPTWQAFNDRRIDELALVYRKRADGEIIDQLKADEDHAARVQKFFAEEVSLDVELEAKRLGIEAGTQAFSDLKASMLEGRLRAYWAMRELKPGVLYPNGFVPSNELELPAQSHVSSWTIRSLSEEFILQSKKTAGWHHKIGISVDVFEQYLGAKKTMPLIEIKKDHIKGYVRFLAQVPNRAKSRFPKLSLHGAITANANLPKPFDTIGANTIKDNYLSPLNRLFDYAINELDVDMINPASTIKVTGASRSNANSTLFEVDELSKLFKQPLFAGCKSPSRTLDVGNYVVTDHQFWVPLIMLFSGARLSELAQLAVSDIKFVGTCHIMDILTEYDEDDPDDRPFVKSFKTSNARRRVPIHPAMIELGFHKYAERMRSRRSVRLFPDWPASSDERKLYSSATWVRRFNEKIIPLVSQRRPRPKLYSLRHTFKTQMAIARVPVQFQDKILGHAPRGMDGTYLKDIPADELYKEMIKVRYESLNLNHLLRYVNP